MRLVEEPGEGDWDWKPIRLGNMDREGSNWKPGGRRKIR